MLCCVVSLSFICFCVVLMVKPPPLQLLTIPKTHSVYKKRKKEYDMGCIVYGGTFILTDTPAFRVFKTGWAQFNCSKTSVSGYFCPSLSS